MSSAERVPVMLSMDEVSVLADALRVFAKVLDSNGRDRRAVSVVRSLGEALPGRAVAGAQQVATWGNALAEARGHADPSRFCSVRTASHRLGVSPQRIRARAEAMGGVKDDDGTWRIPVEAVEEWASGRSGAC